MPDHERIDRLLTVDEVGTWLHLTRPMIYELLNSGEIRSYKIRGARRVSQASVVAYLERSRMAR